MKVHFSINTKSVALPFQVIFDRDNGLVLLAFRFLCFTVSSVFVERKVERKNVD